MGSINFGKPRRNECFLFIAKVRNKIKMINLTFDIKCEHDEHRQLQEDIASEEAILDVACNESTELVDQEYYIDSATQKYFRHRQQVNQNFISNLWLSTIALCLLIYAA